MSTAVISCAFARSTVNWLLRRIAEVGQRGVHAEINGVNAARGAGLTPKGVAPSRPACPACEKALNEMGVPILGP